MTADELWRLPDDSLRYALLRGELQRMAPAGFDHGAVIMNLAGPLSQHVKSGRLGVVCGAETGFVLATNPDTVLAPDIAFVRRTRIPPAGRPRTFWNGAPDLAVEVLSPGDTHRGHRQGDRLALVRHTRRVGGGPGRYVGDDPPTPPDASTLRQGRHAGRCSAVSRVPPAGHRDLRAVGDGRAAGAGRPRRSTVRQALASDRRPSNFQGSQVAWPGHPGSGSDVQKDLASVAPVDRAVQYDGAKTATRERRNEMMDTLLPIPMTTERARAIEMTRVRTARIDARMAANPPHQETMMVLSRLREMGALDPHANLRQLLDRFDAQGGCGCRACRNF